MHGAVKHLLESFSLAGLPLLIGGTQIGRAALPRYFSLGKTVAIVGERPNTWRKRDEARRFRLSSADFGNGSNPALQQHCAGLAPGGCKSVAPNISNARTIATATRPASCDRPPVSYTMAVRGGLAFTGNAPKNPARMLPVPTPIKSRSTSGSSLASDRNDLVVAAV